MSWYHYVHAKGVNGAKKTWKVQVCRVNMLTNREKEQTKIKSLGIYGHVTLYEEFNFF